MPGIHCQPPDDVCSPCIFLISEAWAARLAAESSRSMSLDMRRVSADALLSQMVLLSAMVFSSAFFCRLETSGELALSAFHRRSA